MKTWDSIPLVRLLIPFTGGVLCALLIPVPLPGWSWSLTGWSMVILLLILMYTLPGMIRFGLRWISGVLLWGSLFLAGMLTVVDTQEGAASPLRGTDQPAGMTVEATRLGSSGPILARIIEPPRPSGGNVKLIVRIFETDSLQGLMRRGTKALIVLPADGPSRVLQYGDWILAATSLKPVRGASNPHGFDPMRYYGLKGVFSQGWPDSAAWKQVDGVEMGSLTCLAFRARDRLLAILRSRLPGQEEFSVAAAILLGYTGEIGSGLKRGFAASGAMHILAVSGMHVGIIFLLLEFLLGFLNHRRYGALIKALLMVIMIWVYAFLTGLSPPVFRAAIMLSLLILGKTVRRKPDSLNLLAGSMFILLITDPDLILQIGFQFSYLAVAGILFLYQPVFQLVRPNQWILSRGWGLISVSIAAQLATFPLGLYAFHQFPNYFLLTNLLILPLTSLIMYSGLSLLALSQLPILSDLMAEGLRILVGSLCFIIRFIERLPGAITEGIYPSLAGTLFLYAGIIACCGYFLTRRAPWFIALLLVVLAVSVRSLGRDLAGKDRNLMTVFQVRGGSQYSFVNGSSEVCLKNFRAAFTDPFAQGVHATFAAAGELEKRRTAYLTHRRLTPYLRPCDYTFLKRRGDFLVWNGSLVRILSGPLPSGFTGALATDVVILRDNPRIEVHQIIRHFSPRQIVIDPTNTWANARRWKTESLEHGIPCHHVREDGAFVMDCNSSR